MIPIHLPDVNVYEARNSYWSSQILKGITGEDLYQSRHETVPWGFTIICDEHDKPHTIEFANKTHWSFCAPKDYQINSEWPRFLNDLQNGNPHAHVKNIYSDSMHLSLMSDNSCLYEMLIWKHSPHVCKD